MRILPYLILAYLALGMQSGLGGLLSEAGAVPNFVLIAVIFIASHAAREAALLGCFGLGLMQDLLTQQPLGVYALAYGIVGMMIAGGASPVSRENPLAQMMMTLVGGGVVTLVILLNQRFVPAGPALQVTPDVVVPAIRPGIMPLVIGVLVTAVLAPAFLWPLQKLRKRFAFEHGRWRG
jgi:rod shape-determining protein MreD